MSNSNSNSNSTQFIVPPSIEQSSSTPISKSNPIQYKTTHSSQIELNPQYIERVIIDKFNEHFTQLAEFSNALEKNSERKLILQTKILKNSLQKNIESQLEEKSQVIQNNLLNSTTLKINAEVDAKTKDLDKIVIKAEDEIKDARNSVFTTIALFAAFFTFISVNVNIFSKSTSIEETLVIVLIMWSCILGFLILFFYFLDKKINRNYNIFIYGIIASIGIIFSFYAYALHKKNEALALQYIIKNKTHIPLKLEILNKIIE